MYHNYLGSAKLGNKVGVGKLQCSKCTSACKWSKLVVNMMHSLNSMEYKKKFCYTAVFFLLKTPSLHLSVCLISSNVCIAPIYYCYLIPTHIIFVISISLMILASCCAELVRKCEFELNFYIAKLNNEALFRKPPVYIKLYILFLTPILLDLKQ